MSAAASGVPEIVEAILAAGVDTNVRDKEGHTALWYVADAGTYRDKERHADRAGVVQLLAHAGSDLNAQDEKGDTLLHKTYQVDIARSLIESGANVHVRNKDGETPLIANFSGEVTKLLVAAGADIRARDQNGMNALDHALEIEPNGEKAHYLKSVGVKPTGNHRRMTSEAPAEPEKDSEEPR
jgi:ankyrin repeat protein